ncbi:pentatricopeptide repeat-containing protein At5g61990, mitochondrial-like [Lycium barbarum]|uniref:pentatricopeptide repeat-containing protein At5g61990, mitochondrial-like n=1 Tax=Lycium barbarum TaxID=112863 RepID=UPI00293E4449|nr:pentatricopeptide repeat-containing protein At5g61990, mitochondrial-like [Lycium barbarum]
MAKDIQALANRGVRIDHTVQGRLLAVMVAQSSLVGQVKACQSEYPRLASLRDRVQNGGVNSFSIDGEGVLRCHGIPMVGNVKQLILEEAHSSRYSIHPGATKILALLPRLSAVHPVFHVSMLRRYVGDDSHKIQPENLELAENLTYEEGPISILDGQVRQLRSKKIQLPGPNKSTDEEISTILKHKNWKLLLESSTIPQKLNPDVVYSVLDRNKLVVNPKRLLDFFDWSNQQVQLTQNIDSFSILALALCNSNNFGPANQVFNEMIQRRRFPDILSSLVKCAKECNEFRSKGVVFELPIDAYRKIGMLNEAVSMFLGVKNEGFNLSLLYCNTLLNELLSGNKMELFWEVYEGMLESEMILDVYTYTNTINAYCLPRIWIIN